MLATLTELMQRSAKNFHRAQSKIPGGVNSPVRAWNSVGGVPVFIARGKGSHIFDIDGKRYIDFVGSWGPLILGHAKQEIVQVVRQRALRGFTFGAPTTAEVELAEMVEEIIPSIQKLRLVSSGTEATMSAIRLARAFTGRTKLVKFDGCYHGHSDGLLVKAGSGVATLALPDSAGVPPGFARETLTARLREITRQNGSLLIFDEVITGFRVSRGGAQEIFRVKPDLTCLGKILGGGLPLAAFGGQSKIMDLLAPDGPVYQAGTLSGNPLAVAAGIATLKLLNRQGTYQKLEAKGQELEGGIKSVLRHYGLRAAINRVGSMMTLFFGVDRVTNPDEARACDRQKFRSFFHGMLKRGIYLPPAPFEAMFLSLAHSSADLQKTIDAFDQWAKSQRSVDR